MISFLKELHKMIRAKGILAATVLFGWTALAVLAQRAPDFGGTWIGKTEVPGVGLTEITLVLKKVDKGYSGTIASGNQAVISGSPEIKDVTADGEKLEFVFPLADGTLLFMRLPRRRRQDDRPLGASRRFDRRRRTHQEEVKHPSVRNAVRPPPEHAGAGRISSPKNA